MIASVVIAALACGFRLSGVASGSDPSPAAAPSTNTAAGSSTSSLVMDLTGEEEDVPGCGICGKLSGEREFRLAECGHLRRPGAGAACLHQLAPIGCG